MTNAPAAAPETLLAAPDQATQDEIVREIRARHAELDRAEAAGERVPATAHDFPAYRSSVLRHPTKNPKLVDPETIELFSPAFGQRDVAAIESDLTLQHAGEPLGERMSVQGRLLDSWGRPVANQLIEIWQANAAAATSTSATSTPPRSTRTSPAPAGRSRTRTASTASPRSNRALPVEEPSQRLAPGPHPLLGLRLLVHAAARDADVLPGRPALRARPDLQQHPPAEGPRRPRRRLRPRPHLARVGDGYRFDIVVDGPDATYFEPEDEA